MSFKAPYWWIVLLIGSVYHSFGQNPLITNQYTADPTARVFGDKVFVFPSHDILASEGKGRPGWFCMEDYHTFSSNDLMTWTDHGVILNQENVPWADSGAYSMWAPDCIENEGKYYFYFPTKAQDTTYNGEGFTIGVAVAENPEGPYIPKPKPILGVKGIDPNVFIDHDGQAYLYWSQGHIYGAKLKSNMLELAEEPRILGELPALDKGLKEDPFVFERNGLYYMTYPHVANKTERLEYAIGDNPLGPFEFAGVIMDEWENGCWTNHHSIIQFKKQWYLFYHHNDLSPDFDKSRSIRADSLFFDSEGLIQKVQPTFRGVGLQKATDKIQIDRYTSKSDGVKVAFLDSTNTFDGWFAMFETKDSWIRYNQVKMKQGLINLNLRVKVEKGGIIEVRLNGGDGMLLSNVSIPSNENWQTIEVKLEPYPVEIADLVLVSKGENIGVDWIQFNDK